MFRLSKDQLIQLFKKMASFNGVHKQDYICGTFSGSMIATILKKPKYMCRYIVYEYAERLEDDGVKVDYEYTVSLTNSYPGSCHHEVHIDETALLTKSEYKFLVEQSDKTLISPQIND